MFEDRENLRPYKVKTYSGETYVVGANSERHAEVLVLRWYKQVVKLVRRIPMPPRHKSV